MVPEIFQVNIPPGVENFLLIALTYVWAIVPYVAFFVLLVAVWRLWLYFRRYQFIAKIKWTLIEVRIPKEVFKSPLAMELVLINAFHQGSYGNWYQKYWQGRVPLWFSLEIVSIGGKIYFFMLVPVKYGAFNFKDIVEAQIYSQYPQAEINEVPDYTEMVSLEGPDEWGIWGTEYVLKKEAYPIKTYIDYGVDRAVSLDENQKIDPITSIIEFLGSAGQGEQIWLQILVRASQERFPDPERKKRRVGWADVVKKEIKDLKEKFTKPEKETGPLKQMTPGEKDLVATLERAIAKPAFDCGIRAVYLAQKGKFRPGYIPGLIGLFKSFGGEPLNSFRITNQTSFDFPWQDFGGNRGSALKLEMFDAYRHRSYFELPHKKKWVRPALKTVERKPIVLNSEGLASIYHFPGGVAETPTFARMTAKKSEPPQNLPL